MRKNKSIGKVEKICLRDGCNKTMFIFPSESDTKKYCSNKCKYPHKGLYNVKPIFDKLGTLIQKGE